MTPEAFENIKRDLASFADDENEMVCDDRGNVIFERHGKLLSIQIKEDEDGRKFVNYNGIEIPYRLFLAKELSHLDILASKILQRKYQEELSYVDSNVILMSIDQQRQGKAMSLLYEESKNTALIGTKISFVTADAGHGKSMLLRHFQYSQAQKYLDNNTNFLFWHIDLHGRDLVRLNEAIMYELGELRMPGLYFSSILTLMRHHLIVLGIDGFDELAAEKGGETALNSLSSLVSQMQGKGVLIAASRRAFFNSQDYLRRTNILNRNIGGGCIFNEIKIKNWQREQCVEYLDKYTFNADEYDKLLMALKSDKHPLLERPYLFTKLIHYSFEDNITPSDFINKKGHNNLENINDVIEAFIYREVDKWTQRDKETGRPYLSFEQHVRLLSEVAADMWNRQKNTISVENLQLILTILFDEWKTDSQLRPIILRMVESHAMLVNVENKDLYRKFDHDEFKYFFLARALEDIIRNSLNDDYINELYKFLYVAQLPDTVAQYMSTRIESKDIFPVIKTLMDIRKKDWKPTYIQSNIGTILPFLLNGFITTETIIIDGKISFSSLVFENKKIENVIFRDCTFVNISFNNTYFNNIHFDNCTFTGIIIACEGNSFTDVSIRENCIINTVSVAHSKDENVDTEYSPHAIYNVLRGFNIQIEYFHSSSPEEITICTTDFYKNVKRLLNKYSKTTCLFESNIKQSPLFNFKNPDMIINEIIPLLEEYDIIEVRENRKTRQAGTRAWALKRYDISEVFKAEEDKESKLWHFWEKVKQHE